MTLVVLSSECTRVRNRVRLRIWARMIIALTYNTVHWRHRTFRSSHDRSPLTLFMRMVQGRGAGSATPQTDRGPSAREKRSGKANGCHETKGSGGECMTLVVLSSECTRTRNRVRLRIWAKTLEGGGCQNDVEGGGGGDVHVVG